MIPLEDIITCKSYLELVDFKYDAPNLDDIPPTGVVSVPLDQIDEFFKRIDSNGHRYIIVSSCSDYGLAYQHEHPVYVDMVKWIQMQCGPNMGYQCIQQPARCDTKKCDLSHRYSVKCHSWTRATFSYIPNNVHRWFVSNLMIDDDERLSGIPFGIAEGKAELLYSIMSKLHDLERNMDCYISWNDHTYERYALREYLKGRPHFNIRESGNPHSYLQYLTSLATHRFVVSPPGNGVDCYRTLESLYLGALVIVEDNATNRLSGLPTLKYNTPSKILDFTNNPSLCDTNINDSRTKLSYWKKEIGEAKREIMC